jgi:hypothetical protein
VGDVSSPGTRKPVARWWLIALVVVVLLGAAWLTASLVGTGSDAGANASTESVPGGQGSGSEQVPDEIAMTFPEKTPGQTVPEVAASASPAPKPVVVKLDKPAQLAEDLTVRVVDVESVEGVGRGPGEISGPALRFSIEVTNSTGERVDLTSTVVNAYYGSDNTPASPLAEPGGEPLPATLDDGDSVVGVFVFSVPTDQREQVSVEFSYSVQTPTVIFEGPASS